MTYTDEHGEWEEEKNKGKQGVVRVLKKPSQAFKDAQKPPQPYYSSIELLTIALFAKGVLTSQDIENAKAVAKDFNKE